MSPQFELNDLAVVTGRVHGDLMTAEIAEHAVQLLAEVAAGAVPTATGAGVTLIRAGHPTSTGSTSSDIEHADDIQYHIGEGPCLTSWAASAVVHVTDTRTETRWPRWAAAVAEVSILSSVSVPLLHGGETIGAMKVYSSAPNAFSADTARLLIKLAAAASALLEHIQTSETPLRITGQVAEVLRVRDLTNMAMGVLMATRDMSEAEAHAWLLDASRRQRYSVADVARALVDTTGTEDSATKEGTVEERDAEEARAHQSVAQEGGAGVRA